MPTPSAPPTDTATAPAAPQAPPAPLTLDERLALTNTLMTARLNEAAVAYEVNTHHIPLDRVQLDDVVTVPLTPHLDPQADRTPVARLLHHAHQLLEAEGWCRNVMIDTDGSRCLLGAVRAAAAGNRSLEASAVDVLMDAIRRRFGDHVPSVPSFNDAWNGPRTPLRILDQAVALADARGC
ncbi:hypothetical protein ACFVAQ_36090 [Streptomyces sp. NPDC057651]|uniref:DUF6197 family protein n=1 Tax=Streptomyces sp. NPDC057651 TaxID=3346194 RepID=UPI003674E27D